MKILILGADGNLGGQLVRVFSEHASGEIVPFSGKDLDMLHPDRVTQVVGGLGPDVVINAAAYTAVDLCEQSDEAFEAAGKINGESVGALARAAVQTGALLVHYSTDYVFFGDRAEGYAEDAEPHPINRYGESKLLGERLILKHAGSGLRFYLIRTSKLFGPKAAYAGSKASFFDTMLRLSREQSFLRVVQGERSCFTYTPDLAEATRALVRAAPGYGIYHIVNGEPCTWYEAARELFHLLGMDVPIEPVPPEAFPRPARRPAHSVLLNSKLDGLRTYRAALKEYLFRHDPLGKMEERR